MGAINKIFYLHVLFEHLKNENKGLFIATRGKQTILSENGSITALTRLILMRNHFFSKLLNFWNQKD